MFYNSPATEDDSSSQNFCEELSEVSQIRVVFVNVYSYYYYIVIITTIKIIIIIIRFITK
jgi:hypothetical protein